MAWQVEECTTATMLAQYDQAIPGEITPPRSGMKQLRICAVKAVGVHWVVSKGLFDKSLFFPGTFSLARLWLVRLDPPFTKG